MSLNSNCFFSCKLLVLTYEVSILNVARSAFTTQFSHFSHFSIRNSTSFRINDQFITMNLSKRDTRDRRRTYSINRIWSQNLNLYDRRRLEKLIMLQQDFIVHFIESNCYMYNVPFIAHLKMWLLTVSLLNIPVIKIGLNYRSRMPKMLPNAEGRHGKC